MMLRCYDIMSPMLRMTAVLGNLKTPTRFMQEKHSIGWHFNVKQMTIGSEVNISFFQAKDLLFAEGDVRFGETGLIVKSIHS